MCEANAYVIEDGRERLIMEAVDVIEAEAEGVWRLVGIFGDQKVIKGRIRGMNLVDHKILFEAVSEGITHIHPEGGARTGGHQHKHPHQHDHQHVHEHSHGHNGKEHSHPHEHTHAHGHDHVHPHTHSHGPGTDEHVHDHGGDHGPHDHDHPESA